MSVELLVSLATDFLEYKHLLGLYIVGKNGSLDNCSLNIRGTYFDSSAVLDEEHFVELYSLVFFGCQAVDKDFRASFNFELLPCNINNCVHFNKLLKFGTVSARDTFRRRTFKACRSYFSPQI